MPLSDQKKPRRAAGRAAATKTELPLVTEAVPSAEVAVVEAVAREVSTDVDVLLKELGRAEEVVGRVGQLKNLDELFAYGKLLDRVEGITGVTKMRFLFLVKQNWAEWQAQSIVEDAWEDVVRAKLGITPSSAKKYIRAWEQLWENRLIPDKLRNAWLDKPVEHWVRIVGAAENLSDPQWKAATTARYGSEIAEISRAARGGKARTSSGHRVTIQLRRKTGELRAWQGGGKPVTIGKLAMDEKSQKNTVIQRATARILAAAGIVEE